MKQLEEQEHMKMQEQMQDAQAELSELEVQGQAGGGMVQLTMTCRREVRSINIDQELLGDDREMLEDILVAAFNDALRKVETTTKEKYSGMTSGMGLPPGLNLPF